MRDLNDDLAIPAGDDGDGFYGVKARPQRSRLSKKTDKNSRSKKIKRSGPVSGLHQRRNKRISW